MEEQSQDQRPHPGNCRPGPISDSLAAGLDEQYRARLCRLVEREIDRRFRRTEDPEDVVQSAFLTVCRRYAEGELHIDPSADLWRLLATITRNKMLKHCEKLRAAKRDARREEYPEGDVVPGQGPSPEDAAIVADLIENALAGLDESHAAAFYLRLNSHTEEEIADKLVCTRARVRGKLDRIRERLERLRVRGTKTDDWQPAELSAHLRRCLETQASDYLDGDAPPEQAAMSGTVPIFAGLPRSGEAKMGLSPFPEASMTLEELLRAPRPARDLLVAVKVRARRLAAPGSSNVPSDVHRVIYFGSIAAAILRLSERVSKSDPGVLRAGLERLASQTWIEDWLRELLAASSRRLAEGTAAEGAPEPE